MKTYGADVTNLQNEHIYIAFNADSGTAARQYLEGRDFVIRSLYVIPRSPGTVLRQIPQKLIKIHTNDRGLDIILPIHQEKFIYVHHFLKGGLRALGIWLAAWTIIGVLGIGVAFNQYSTGHLPWWILLSLCGWLVGEAITLLVFVVSMFGVEKIRLSPTHLTLGTYLGSLGKSSKHPLHTVEGFQRLPGENRPNKFVLNYAGHSIPFGRYITDAEADAAYAQLQAIVEARCHRITDVLLGSIPETLHTETLAVNPNVADLQFPYVHLRHIHIDVETGTIYQVEQFVTYAVNIIGSERLQEQVTAHVYGPVEQLHSNIHNTLTNLCREVVTHTGSYLQEHAPQ